MRVVVVVVARTEIVRIGRRIDVYAVIPGHEKKEVLSSLPEPQKRSIFISAATEIHSLPPFGQP
jgi:hypothetical protein